MYNREIEFDDFFDDIDLEDKNLQMSVIKKSVKKKVFVHRVVSTVRNTAIACIAFAFVFTIGVNTSPAFAEMISRIPIIGELVQKVSNNEGIKDALNNEYLTEINQKAHTELGDIYLSHCLADEKKVVLFFKIENAEDIEHTNLEIDAFRNLDNGIEDQWSGGIVDHFDDEYIVQTIDLTKEMGYPEHLQVECNVQNKEMEEHITFEITLEKPLPAKEYVMNKAFEVRGQKYNINKVTIYPTCTVIDYKENENNTMETISIKFHLENKAGVKRGDTTAVTTWDDDGMVIDSGYFVLGNDITLVVDQVELLPKEMENVTYNVKTKEFFDINGLMENVHVIDGKKMLEEMGYIDEYEEDMIFFVIDNKANKSHVDSFYEVDDNGEYMNTMFRWREMEDCVLYTMPKSIENDADGIVHLVRMYSEFNDYPNIVIPVK